MSKLEKNKTLDLEWILELKDQSPPEKESVRTRNAPPKSPLAKRRKMVKRGKLRKRKVLPLIWYKPLYSFVAIMFRVFAWIALAGYLGKYHLDLFSNYFFIFFIIIGSDIGGYKKFSQHDKRWKKDPTEPTPPMVYPGLSRRQSVGPVLEL